MNAFLSYMVHEHEYVRNPRHQKEESIITPEVGISNETAIKRIKDFEPDEERNFRPVLTEFQLVKRERLDIKLLKKIAEVINDAGRNTA